MRTLELKIPPPIVLLLVAGAMWWVASHAPHFELPTPIRVGLAVVLGLVGMVFSSSGARAFRRAKTTINPMKPAESSTLVCTGIYRVTRNPMYVGLTCLLLGWAVFLTSPWTLLGPLGFALYITRFQIVPEERVLAAKFGADYAAYQSKVRRWL